jgi:hypothetical protein
LIPLRRSAFIAAAGAALVHPSAARAGPGARMVAKSPGPAVHARIGARTVMLLIDTASASSTLTPGSAAALGLTGTSLAGVSFAGETLRAHPMSIGDVGRWNALTGLTLDGVLGYEAFRDRVLTLDYHNRRVFFPDIYPDGEQAQITWLRYDANSAPLVTISDVSVDGFPAGALIDTALGKNAVIFESKLPDLAMDNEKDRRLGPFEYAGEPLRPARVGSVRLGTTTLMASVRCYGADAQAHVPASEVAIILGSGIFQSWALTLDFPGSRAIVRASG